MSNVSVRFKNTTAANSGKLLYIVGSTGTNVTLDGQQTTTQNVSKSGNSSITQTIKTTESSNVVCNVHNLDTTNLSISVMPAGIVITDGNFAKVNVTANVSQTVSLN